METEMMLTVDHVSKSEEDGVILSDLTFSIPKKGVHGILAPKGAGKTALMKILAGWDDRFDGAIFLSDADLTDDFIARKRRIGFLPASPSFDPTMTVSEIMHFVGCAKGVASEKRESRIREALDLMGLTALSAKLSRNLSLYERKKLSLATALVGNPKLLLIDEPSLGLGNAEAKEMWELIRMLGGVKTVLLSTDRYEEVESLCDDILLMADGRILAEGSISELEERLRTTEGQETMTLSEVYRSLCVGRKEDEQ